MYESFEEKEKTTPLLKKSEKQVSGETDQKLGRLATPDHTINTEEPLNLSMMPPEVVHSIAEQLYNQKGGDEKTAPSKDVARLKAASRHFYGKNPDTSCLPNTRKYAEKSIRLFTCELGLELLEVGTRPDYRAPDEVNGARDCCNAAIICACCLPISISAGVVGCLIGGAIDTRNAINSTRVKQNRSPKPENGYLSIPLSGSEPPSNQSMR